MTRLSCPPPGQPPLLLLRSTMPCVCVCAFVCMCHRERQTQRVVNRRTGRLVICLSAFRLPKHCLLVTTLCTRKFEWRREFASCYLRVCALPEHVEGVTCFFAVLSKPVCSPGGCHGNSQTAADFAPASSGDFENREEDLRARNLTGSLKKL